MAEIDITIDGMTNCLVRRSDGKLFDTEYQQFRSYLDKARAREMQREGWRFDWSEPQAKGDDLYALYLQGDDEVQGLIAMRDFPSEYYTFVDVVESNPCDVGEYGLFKGVGSHLFAIACKHSLDAGFGGFVAFDAKTRLIDHCRAQLGAEMVGSTRMYIATEAAIKLVENYFPEAAR